MEKNPFIGACPPPLNLEKSQIVAYIYGEDDFELLSLLIHRDGTQPIRAFQINPGGLICGPE